MGLSGASPLGKVETKAPNSPNSDYHNHRDAPSVAARQAEVARDYLKRAARINELNGHPPGSDGQMATALKRHNGGTNNDDAKRTKGMYRQCIQKAWGHTAHRGWARLLLNREDEGLIIHGPAHRGANGAAMPTDEDDQDGHFFFNNPERGDCPAA